MPVRDNITAPDGYTEAASLRCEPTDRITITVTGGAILAQFALASPAGLRATSYDFNPTERRMVNAIYNWTPRDFYGAQIVGVRVRRAVSTDAPQVTIDA